MADTLRTRIAAAIMESCHGVFMDDAVDAADAVIRELKLTRQDNDLDTSGPYRHRYVTEWTADE